MQDVNKAFYKNTLVLIIGSLLASGNVVRCSAEPSYCSGTEEADTPHEHERIRMKERERHRDVMRGSKSDSELPTLHKRGPAQLSVPDKDESRRRKKAHFHADEEESDKDTRDAEMKKSEDSRERDSAQAYFDGTRIRKSKTLGKVLVAAGALYVIWRIGKKIYS